MCAGGGSGGHVTPVVVVINEIIRQSPDADIMFVCDKAFEHQARGLMKNNADKPVETKVIAAGKLRRYSHLSFWQHFLVPGLALSNIVDIAKVGWGVVQSVAIFASFRPDVVFAKGGYVCLPVGIVAHLLRVPLVIHDSDARPGITNKILSRWAIKIATGAPLDNYNYPVDRSVYVGVPIAKSFHPYDEQAMNAAKRSLGFAETQPLVVVTGGGLGAKTINDAIVKCASQLLDCGVGIYHVTGKKHYDEVIAAATSDVNYKIVPFVFDAMPDVLGAADVVVSRASATFIQELAGLAKPAVLVPSRALGDQIRNANAYKAADAAIVCTDDELEQSGYLKDILFKLLNDESRRKSLSSALHEFAKPQAAIDVARLIIDASDSR